jgi:aminoglycoside phosphotransferase
MTPVVHDLAAMREHFAAAMPHCRVDECALLNVRHKPGKRLLASYRLRVNASTSQLVYAALYSERSAAHFAKAQKQPLVAPAFGDPVFHLPDIGAVVWSFPNDRKLIGLPALVDATRLAEIARALVNGSGPVSSVSHQVVHYIPEHGCTLRVTAEAAGAPRSFYGKAYADEAGQTTWENMRALWRSGAVRMAQPLAYDPDARILWQAAVEGVTLADAGPACLDIFPALAAAARSIAALHATPIPGLNSAGASVAAEAAAAAERLSLAMPHRAREIEAFARALTERAAGLEPRPLATVHGDLHWDNVVYSRGAPAGLIDLDNLRAGDPLRDLGSFLASTCVRCLLDDAPAPRIAAMTEAVLAAYVHASPWPVERPVLNCYTAAALFSEQAHRAVVRMKRERLARLDTILDMAERAL